MAQTISRSALLILAGCLLAAGILGCTHQQRSSWGGSRYGSHVHTVRYPGESFSLIAKWYTGNSQNWTVLARANPQVDPRRIRIGDKIYIPRNILKTSKPMPHSFVTGSTPRKTGGADSDDVTPRADTSRVKEQQSGRQAQPTEAAPSGKGDLELFGPRE